MKPGLLIIAHAPLASALRDVAQHTYPDFAETLQALDVLPGMAQEQVEAEGRELLERMGTPEALIFTDVFGATPCNGAQRLADGVHVRVVTGVNVPMLWRSLCYCEEPLESLVHRALAGAVQGAMQVTVTRPQHQANGRSPHDQDDTHNQ